MHKIQKITAREILDSRGNPTVEANVILESGETGRASVPSGKSTGKNEALELKASKAIENVNTKIAKVLIGMDAENQREIDGRMIELDGTENKSSLGANAVLAVSLAAAKAATLSKNIPLFEHIRSFAKNPKPISLPLPLCNILNGGVHTNWQSTDIQEFMVAPVGAKTFAEAMQMLTKIFNSLGKIIEEKGYNTKLGDEGGYAPHLKGGNKEALELICEAVQKAGYKLSSDIFFTLDIAASELYKPPSYKAPMIGKYKFETENKEFDSDELIEYYKNLVKEFPIFSIEDPFAEDDWQNWIKITEEMSKVPFDTQIVGDDLLVTNVKFLERAIKEKAANAILIKPNQVGTLSETIDAVDMAHSAGWNTIISHRSGETSDTIIAHIAVGLGSGQIKTGSVSQPERMAKYNELLKIEKLLGSNAIYAGKNIT